MRRPGHYDARPGTPKKAQPPAIMNPLRALHIEAKAAYKRRFYLLRKVSPRDGEMDNSPSRGVRRVLGDHQGRRYQELASDTLVQLDKGRPVGKRRRREHNRSYRKWWRGLVRNEKRANGGRRVDLSAGGVS